MTRRKRDDSAPVQPAGREVPHPTYTTPPLVREVPNDIGARTGTAAPTPAVEPGKES